MADSKGQQPRLLEAPHELALPSATEKINDTEVAKRMEEEGAKARTVLSQIDQAENNQQ